MPVSRRSRALVACVAFLSASAALAETQAPKPDFPEIPLPAPIEGLIGMPQAYAKGRQAYLALIRAEAERAGLPPDVADAVAQVESAYNPRAVGGVGEIGLMQIRPETAAMLGFRGSLGELAVPETHVRYSVRYLARAWELAGGDLCRALMKYRAGHGEERMSPLSVEYCRRAKVHLATIGSPLGAGALPAVTLATASFGDSVRAAASAGLPTAGPAGKPPQAAAPATRAAKAALPPSRDKGVKVAAVGEVRLSPRELQKLAAAREREQARRTRSRQMWAAHEARLDAINAKLKSSTLRIANGI